MAPKQEGPQDWSSGHVLRKGQEGDSGAEAHRLEAAGVRGSSKNTGDREEGQGSSALRPFKMSGGEETRGRGVISAAPRGPQPAGLLKGVEGKGLGTEPMEKVEQMGESLGWGRSPDSWDSGEGAWRKMGEGKMRCSFWDGGPVRAVSTAPGRPGETTEHGHM